jgi:hypothetical protein
MTSLRIAATDLRLANHCRLILVRSFVAFAKGKLDLLEDDHGCTTFFDREKSDADHSHVVQNRRFRLHLRTPDLQNEVLLD